MPDNEVLLTEDELNSYMRSSSDGNYVNLNGKPTFAGQTINGDITYLIFNAIYPVGSIYISTDVNFNPVNVFGGTWEKIQGRFLLGSGVSPESSAKTYTTGQTGGSKNAIIPSHGHNLLGETRPAGGAHRHGPGNSSSTHFMFRNNASIAVGRPDGITTQARKPLNSNSKGNLYTWMSSTIEGLNSSQNTGSTNIEHVHQLNGTTTSTGVAATDKNMPPYLVVNIWKRTGLASLESE